MASELTGKIVKRGVEKDNASTAHRKNCWQKKLRGHFSSSTKYSINQLDGAKSNATSGMERGANSSKLSNYLSVQVGKQTQENWKCQSTVRTWESDSGKAQGKK